MITNKSYTVVSKMADKNSRVRTRQGWLEGERKELVTGNGNYYSFKGVPYAAPPVGRWRFRVRIYIR